MTLDPDLTIFAHSGALPPGAAERPPAAPQAACVGAAGAFPPPIFKKDNAGVPPGRVGYVNIYGPEHAAGLVHLGRAACIAGAMETAGSPLLYRLRIVPKHFRPKRGTP